MKWLLKIRCAAVLGAVLAMAGCSVTDHTREARLDPAAKWVLLPIANHTDTPQAGLRAEAIAETLLRSAGVARLERYPPSLNPDALFDPAERKVEDQALAWAKTRNARYAVGGSVEEWRYKVGVDGEPAVGLSFTITDLESGAVLYASSGARSGWSREALSAVAQKLMRELLSGVHLAK